MGLRLKMTRVRKVAPSGVWLVDNGPFGVREDTLGSVPDGLVIAGWEGGQ